MFLFIIINPLIFCSHKNSNTSHVLIYHISNDCNRIFNSIQIHLMFLFIAHSLGIPDQYINSNTSHVLIYREINKYKFRESINSNTSHVLIYHPVSCIPENQEKIQIHLMFLFIH